MAYNTIKIKKYSDVVEELTATAVAITPGMLLEVTSAGTVQAHGTAAGNVLPMFALENELLGEGIATNYAASAKIQVWIPGRGDVVYALLNDGENAVKGAFLESAGNGKLQVHASASADVNLNPIVGVAVTAVDMSGSSGVDPDGRICVRIL